MILWDFQAFHHHEHYFHEDETEGVEIQNEERLRLLTDLAEQFPHLSFLVHTIWLDRTTWYQTTPEAPNQDGPWENYPARPDLATEAAKRTEGVGAMRQGLAENFENSLGGRGRLRRCLSCGEHAWGESYELPEVRGIRWMNCNSCGNTAIEATKEIRDRIGPPEPFLVPRIP